MKTLLIFTTLVLTGCVSPRAIKTEASYTPAPVAGEAAFEYKSEKDILYTSTTDPATGVVETSIQILASAPAYAQAQRELAYAELLREIAAKLPSAP